MDDDKALQIRPIEQKFADDHLAGMSARAIAKKYGISHNAVYQAFKRPAVAAYIQQEKKARIQGVRAALSAAVEESVVELRRIISDPAAKDSDKIAACREILGRGGVPEEQMIVQQVRSPEARRARLAELRKKHDGT